MVSEVNTSNDGVSTESKSQFRLWHLLYIIAILAVALSLSWWVLFAVVVWISVCWHASNRPNLRARIIRLLAIIFAYFVSWSFFFPVNVTYSHSERIICSNNARQLVLAMLNYESEYGEFPKAQVFDSEGKPMHSWRVLILPFIEEQSLYDQYDFTQPWDSPTNLKLVSKMPSIYRIPFANEQGVTEFKLVVGEGTLFDGGPRTYDRISDGSSNTIALVQDAAEPVEWTRPSDVTIEEAMAILKPSKDHDFTFVEDSFFKKCLYIGCYARFDGSIGNGGVFHLNENDLRKCLGIENGVPSECDDLRYGSPQKVITKISPTLGVMLFVALMLLPLSWVLRSDVELQQT